MKSKIRVFRWINHIPNLQTLTPDAISGCVGLTTGPGVRLFKQAFALVQPGMDGASGCIQPDLGKWTMVLAAAAGGVIVGLILS